MQCTRGAPVGIYWPALERGLFVACGETVWLWQRSGGAVGAAGEVLGGSLLADA